jgi:hypothetical protein
MMVFENRMLRRIFGPKWDKVRMKCRACRIHGEGQAFSGNWWGNLRERVHLGNPRRRWDDNIKINLQEMACGDTDWIDLAQDRDRWRARVNAIMKFRVP